VFEFLPASLAALLLLFTAYFSLLSRHNSTIHADSDKERQNYKFQLGIIKIPFYSALTAYSL